MFNLTNFILVYSSFFNSDQFVFVFTTMSYLYTGIVINSVNVILLITIIRIIIKINFF